MRDIEDIVIDEARRGIRWRLSSMLDGCIINLLLFVILSGLAVFTAVKMLSPASLDFSGEEAEATRRDGERPSVVWSGDAPFTCEGNTQVEIVGAKASLPGQVAIVAGGNCDLTLVDVEVSAETALLVKGNARVTIRGRSLLKGEPHAVEVTGNAAAVSHGATIEGDVDVSGNGGFDQVD